MALAFDLRRPVVRRFPDDIRSHLVYGLEVCSVASSFIFLFAFVMGVF
ncbi:hypothetical protein GGD50_002874 [Rhizobium paranaense]|uniref:Uncharacterized protein n=1 Tax=Rhizobium paranaense TaxID=1650438 RepID=A0A7W9D1F4_9HYPH|nr:hypothetical protein [Rhizobium paranaense]